MYRWFRDHRRPVRIVICKARRAGLSTGVESLIYDDSTTNPNTYSLIVANERNPSENILQMCRVFWKNTPEYFDVPGHGRIMVRPPLPPQFNNNPPKDRIEFDEPLASRIFVATARSVDAYLGYGFQNMHATEAAYYTEGHELFRALYPTLSTDAHSALYIESTPNGQTGRGAWFHEQCMDAAARKDTDYGEMRLVFIAWHEMRYSFSIPFRTPEARSNFEHSLKQTEKDLIRRFDVSLEQLQWRRMILAGPTFNRDEDMFDQEYPSDLATAFLMSGTAVYGRKHIKRLMAQSRAPKWEGDIYWGESDEKNEREPSHEVVRRPRFLTKGEARARGFKPHVNEGTFNNLKVYRWPQTGERLFVTADVGEGNPESKDGDFSTICVGVLNELGRDELIMTWRGHLNPVLFAEVCAALSWGVRYRVGDGVVAPELAVEWNGPGKTTCTYIDTKNLYPSTYRYQPLGVHGLPKSKHIGWESNAKTKPPMIDFSLRMVDRDLIDIPDEDLILEMSTYRKIDSFGDEGSFGGAAGRHDDMVSSFQILCVLLRLRSAVIPGEAPMEEVSMDDFGDNDLPPFDPFAGEIPIIPGAEARDLDEESLFEIERW